jgi:putative solute:sodium symporter small subunit
MTSSKEQYWKANLKLVYILMIIWFIVSYVFGILLFEVLNHIKIGGMGMGLWFAQQGSIYVFLILIFVYVKKMNKLDKEHGVEED